MSDPQPDSPPNTQEPDGTPTENPSGSRDAITGLELNPDVPLVDPSGG